MTQDELQDLTIQKVVDFFYNGANKKGYLDLAMRSGKTKIAIMAMEILLYPDSKILISYPDNKLKHTWMGEFEKWSPGMPSNLKITYTNFSSLKKYTEEFFDVVIVDEFHSLSEAEANYVREIICGWNLFLSGTVSKETKDKWPDFKEIAKYTTLDGISDGILSDYIISVHLVALDNIIKSPNKKGKLLTEKQKYDNYSYVITQMQRDGRNAMHLALARNRLSLSSIGKMAYLRNLLITLEGKRIVVFTGLTEVADAIGIPSYHNKSEDDSVYKDFLDKKINQLALAAMGKVGVTYPDLDSVILLNFTYNKEESSQILNRAIKLDYKDKVADLHVICLNEPAELKKVKESLSMLDNSKIKYV